MQYSQEPRSKPQQNDPRGKEPGQKHASPEQQQPGSGRGEPGKEQGGFNKPSTPFNPKDKPAK